MQSLGGVVLYTIFYSSFSLLFFFSSRRRHTRFSRDWSSDVCSSDLAMSSSRASSTMSNSCSSVTAIKTLPCYPTPLLTTFGGDHLLVLALAAHPGLAKIGRASCRERV